MKDFITALQFLTRIKVAGKIQTKEGDFARSVRFFPLIGVLLGAVLFLLALALSGRIGILTTAVLLAAAEIILTGGLHLDGFMDSCDGLFSGRPRAQMLEIMKDSRVGAMGVIGLFLLLSVKIALLTELSGRHLYYALLLMPFFGRWAVVWVMMRYPYARKEGLGKYFIPEHGYRLFAIVSFFCLVFYGLITFFFASLWFFWALPASALAVIGLCGRINAALEGHTGDTYGAVIESAEVIFLFFIVFITKITL